MEEHSSVPKCLAETTQKMLLGFFAALRDCDTFRFPGMAPGTREDSGFSNKEDPGQLVQEGPVLFQPGVSLEMSPGEAGAAATGDVT